MFPKRSIHVRHHLFRYALLDVDGLEKPGEARAEDGVHVVGVVQADEGGVHSFGLKVAEQGSSDWTHALDVPACLASEREAMEDVE